MSRKFFFPFLLALFLGVIAIAPSVYAQTTTSSVTIQSSSSHVVLGSDGTAHFTVTAQVTYTGFTHPTLATLSSIPNVLTVVIGTTVAVNGTAIGSPDSCNIFLAKPALGYVICDMTPFMSSGRETVTFNVIVYNAQSQQYRFEAVSFISSSSGGGPYSALSGSISMADLYVTLVNHLTVTIAVPAQVAVTIDGVAQNPGPVTVTESLGTHVISVPQTVQVNGTQLNFAHWSDGSNQTTRSIDIEDGTTLAPSYVSQYLLNLTDPLATGSGWYNQGSTVQISVPSSEPLPGILGLLGGTQTFQGWYENGNLVSSSYSSSITMNAPHTLTAQWSTDTTVPLIVVNLMVVVVGGGLFAFDAHSHRRRTIGPTPTPPQTRATQTVTPPTEEKPRSSETRQTQGSFCVNCGAKLPEDPKFCNNVVRSNHKPLSFH